METASKPTIFLVSDSTVQSYPRSMAPQNNVYNQTNYTSYYYAHDCDFSKIPLDEEE